MRRTHFFLAGLIVLTGGVGLAGWNIFTGSPKYALAQVRTAVAKHDRDTFERYVDVESVVDHAVDDVFDYAIAVLMAESKGDGLATLGAAFGSALIDEMKPAIKAGGRQALLRAVETGSFADAAAEVEALGTSGEIDIAEMGSAVGFAQETFAGVGDLRQNGDVAAIPLRFRPPRLDTTLTVSARLERINDVWTVSRVTGVDTYLRTVYSLQEAKLAAVNDSILEVLEAYLETGPVRSRLRQNGWFSQVIVLSSTVRNAGPHTLSEVVLSLSDRQGELPTEDVALHWLGQGEKSVLPPGDSVRVVGILNYNPFLNWHNRLTRDLTARPILVSIYGTHDLIQRYENWDQFVASTRRN